MRETQKNQDSISDLQGFFKFCPKVEDDARVDMHILIKRSAEIQGKVHGSKRFIPLKNSSLKLKG